MPFSNCFFFFEIFFPFFSDNLGQLGIFFQVSWKLKNWPAQTKKKKKIISQREIFTAKRKKMLFYYIQKIK